MPNNNNTEGQNPPPMADIFEMAKQMASSMPAPDSDEKLDMPGMVKHVTESVMSMMGNGEMDINQMTGSLMQNLMDPNNPLSSMLNPQAPGPPPSDANNYTPIPNSKIKLPGQTNNKNYKFKEPVVDKNFEELDDDDDDDIDQFSPRTKDIDIEINVNLEDFYNGTKKKLAVRRKRLKKNKKGNVVPTEEKKKIIIPIDQGMRDGQVIRYNKEADEAQGFESGDIVITLYENIHSRFEREADNLFIMKDISLYEAFAASCGEDISLTVKHLDGSLIKLKMGGNPLHVNDGIRKVVGEGMPRFKQEGRGDLYVRFNLVLPEKFKAEDAEILKKLFPVCNEPYNLENKEYRECVLEEVSESDLEELDHGFSDSDSDSSDYSDSTYVSSDSDPEPRNGFRKLPKRPKAKK